MKKLFTALLAAGICSACFGFEMPPLPYDKAALEPVMSKETVEYHYGRHLKTYVDNLNKLIAGTRYENDPLEVIIRDSEGSVFNNAAQVANHILFFDGLNSPSLAQHSPGGELAKAIDETFGSFDEFKNVFKQLAVSQFGSGWAWLVLDKSGVLGVMQTSNADTPVKEGYAVLMVCDVWEHSYYIDYRNRRADYVDDFWKVVDWKEVEKRYEEGWAKVM